MIVSNSCLGYPSDDPIVTMVVTDWAGARLSHLGLLKPGSNQLAHQRSRAQL